MGEEDETEPQCQNQPPEAVTEACRALPEKAKKKSWQTPISNGFSANYIGTLYKVYGQKMTFHDATRVCRNDSSELVILITHCHYEALIQETASGRCFKA